MQTKTKLETIVVEPQTPAEYSIIWLHGLGADGNDFASLPGQMQISKKFPIRFIFPHAPHRSITINGGMQMRAWYDILELSLDSREDAAGVHESRAAIEELIDTEVQKGIPTKNIFLAGFSQGGAMALHTGLLYQHKLAGIIALSTYLPLAQEFPTQERDSNISSKIFMAHGHYDPILPLNFGKQSCALLEKLGYAVAWHDYPMEHGVCGEEVMDLDRWLHELLQ